MASRASKKMNNLNPLVPGPRRGPPAAAWRPGPGMQRGHRHPSRRTVGYIKGRAPGLFFISLPLGRRQCPRVLPRRHATQRARSEIFKLSLIFSFVMSDESFNQRTPQGVIKWGSQGVIKWGSPSRFINQPRSLRQRLWPHHEGAARQGSN